MALDPAVKAVVARKLEEYEGRYPHLYLDTKGKVTVGVGHMIPNRDAIALVPFYLRSSESDSEECDLDHRQVTFQCFVVTSGNSAKVFQLTNQSLHNVSLTVSFSAEVRVFVFILPVGDHISNGSFFQPFKNITGHICFIASQIPGTIRFAL